MKKKVKVLISWRMGEEFVEELKNRLYDIKHYEIELIAPETKNKKVLKKLIKDVDILLAGITDIDLLEEGKNLKFIQALTSSVGRIDLTYTSNRQIPVCSAKGPNAIAVAEHTLMLMLMLAKNATSVVSIDEWPKDKPLSTELFGKNIGILGAGYTGKEVARLAKGIGMTVYGIDKYHSQKSEVFDHLSGIDKLYEILPYLDFLTINVPSTRHTLNMISLKEMRTMKPESYIINVSRGSVVNLNDLEFALRHKIIKGAAVDVFPQEPPDYNHPIFNLSNFIYTPHIAGNTKESVTRKADYVYRNIENFLYRHELTNLVNPEVGF